MYKKSVLFTLIFFGFTCILSACNSTAVVNNTREDTVVGSTQKEVSVGSNHENAADTSTGNAADSTREDVSAGSTRKIVFNTTIDDPQTAYLNTLGGGESTGRASISLTLYETGEDVFEGYGWITRIWNQSDESMKMQQKLSYRTGLISIKPGSTANITMIGRITEDKDLPTMIDDAPFNFVTHKEGSNILKNLPLSLELNSNKATLSLKIHEKANLQFQGELTKGSVESQVRSLSINNGLIYINSQWSDSINGGAADYTAVLLASPATGSNEYSGNLLITGNGKDLAKTDAEVSFTLFEFDDKAYKSAGGKQTGEFTRMSIFENGGKTYVLLMDGDEAILEPCDTGRVFYGNLFGKDESASLLNQANKTKTMVSYLYRQTGEASISNSPFEGLDTNKPEDMKKLAGLSEELSSALASENGAPAWYPAELIPAVSFSEYDGYLTTPAPSMQFFKNYITEYAENEDFADLVAPYRKALSKYDVYKEYMDTENGEGVFVFTMGRYSIQVFLMQSALKMSSVNVQIY